MLEQILQLASNNYNIEFYNDKTYKNRFIILKISKMFYNGNTREKGLYEKSHSIEVEDFKEELIIKLLKEYN